MPIVPAISHLRIRRASFTVFTTVLLSLAGTACRHVPTARDELADRARVRGLVQAYEDAVNAADADALEALFWVDDPRFTEVEDFISQPFGKQTFREIGQWIRENAEPGRKQRFHDTSVYLLSPTTAYIVTLQDQLASGRTSRVTFVALKKGDDWRFIHGHFSNMPEE